MGRVGKAIGDMLERLGILADEETSERLSRVDQELDALELDELQRRILARAEAGDFDALADWRWADKT